MPNIENLNRLIERVRTLKHAPVASLPSFDTDHFSMCRYNYECGAPACLAGHASNLFNTERHYITVTGWYASHALGLDEDWAHFHLFSPDWSLGGIDHTHSTITPEMGARALERVRDAGDHYLSLTLRDIWGD